MIRAPGPAGYGVAEPVSHFDPVRAPFSVASHALGRPPADFGLEHLRDDPGLLAEFERLVARWSIAAPTDAARSCGPRRSIAPPALKAFYAIAHHWPGARLHGSQDFLRPLNKLARDGGKLTFITESQGNFRIALESHRGRVDAVGLHVRAVWVPMDGTSLPHLLVTFGLQELMFGARYLTAHSSQTIEQLPDRRAGSFRSGDGTYADDTEWDVPLAPERRDRRQARSRELVLVRTDAAGAVVGVPRASPDRTRSTPVTRCGAS